MTSTVVVKNEEDMVSSTSTSGASMSDQGTAHPLPLPAIPQPVAELAQSFTSRLARSNAPSVSTHRAQVAPGSQVGESQPDEDDEPVLMEVRDVKTQPGTNEIPMSSIPMQPNFRRQPMMHGRARTVIAVAEDSARPGRAGQSAANVSFVTTSFTAIGDKVKELNDTLGELQSLGIQHVTNLPELVLVGDQSAGKSSLMSSFSGIVLPRSEGACTRCPVHIRLSGAASSAAATPAATAWSCRVSLQEDYSYRAPANVTRANPFGPWFEKRRDVKEFATLTDPAQIEDTLRWAQIATLNPSRPHALYKPGTGDIWRRHHRQGHQGDGAADGNGSEEGAGDLPQWPSDNEAAFSPNTVALDVLAPGMPDLSFYDLPGVFTSAKRDEDQYLVRVVENLTAKYIAHEQAIILWAVPMNADPETSSTFSIIRRQKAQARTIGIMTKADLLPPNPGAENQWLAMLLGEQHRVGHGYFLTARPTTAQDLLSADEATPQPQATPASPATMPPPPPSPPSRVAHAADELERQSAFEEAFFNQRLRGLANREWSAHFREFEDRCGVTRLVSFMSQQLGYEFAKCLPSIKEKVSDKLLDVNEELAHFPDLPDNPELEIRRSLAEFAGLVAPTLEGPQLNAQLNDLLQQFQHAILQMKPMYNVKDTVQANGRSMGHRNGNGDGHGHGHGNGNMVVNRIDLTNDDDSVSPRALSVQPTPRRRRHADFLDGHGEPVAASPATPSKRARGSAAPAAREESPAMAAEYSPMASRALAVRPPPGLFGRGAHNGGGSPLLLQAAEPLPGGTAHPGGKVATRSLATVREIIRAKSNPGMPDIVTDAVYNALCMEAVQPWGGPLHALVDQFARALETTLHALLALALDGLQARLVFARATAALRAFVAGRVDRLRADLAALHRLETRRFYTLDNAGIHRFIEVEGKALLRHRHRHRMLAYEGSEHSAAAEPLPDWDSMAEEERKQETARRNQEAARLGPDPFKIELDVCAYVRAYYLTAATRFIDTCTLHLVNGVVPDMVDTLSRLYLDQSLGLVENNAAARADLFEALMAEDAATAARRETLKEDRRRFQRTMASIERLESSSQGGQSQEGV